MKKNIKIYMVLIILLTPSISWCWTIDNNLISEFNSKLRYYSSAFPYRAQQLVKTEAQYSLKAFEAGLYDNLKDGSRFDSILRIDISSGPVNFQSMSIVFTINSNVRKYYDKGWETRNNEDKANTILQTLTYIYNNL